MSALALNPRCKGLFRYTCSDVPWTGAQSDFPESPQRPSSASESPCSSGSSHTLGRHSSSALSEPPARARSPSYAPETPTRSPSYAPETPTRQTPSHPRSLLPVPAPSPLAYRPETPTHSPSPYTPDTPSPWMTTLTSNPASPSNTTTTTFNTNVRRNFAVAHRPTLPSIARILQSTSPPPLPNWLPAVARTPKVPLSQPLQSPRALRPARTAASPPSPGPGLLYFVGFPPRTPVQPVPRRNLGVEERSERWLGIVRAWEGETEMEVHEVERQSVARDGSHFGTAGTLEGEEWQSEDDPDEWAVGEGEEEDEEEEEEQQWRSEVLIEVRRSLLAVERRVEEHARRRWQRMARRWCVRGKLDLGSLRIL